MHIPIWDLDESKTLTRRELATVFGARSAIGQPATQPNHRSPVVLLRAASVRDRGVADGRRRGRRTEASPAVATRGDEGQAAANGSVMVGCGNT